MNDEITPATETEDRIDIRHGAFVGIRYLNICHLTATDHDPDGGDR